MKIDVNLKHWSNWLTEFTTNNIFHTNLKNCQISVIDCSNITRYEPRSCCPSFPKIENKETNKCGRQCAQKNDSQICCVSNCTLNEVKGINADGSFNVKAITEYFVKYSNLKNNTDYTSLVADIVQKCVAGTFLHSS